jgi:hypothetical protein
MHPSIAQIPDAIQRLIGINEIFEKLGIEPDTEGFASSEEVEVTIRHIATRNGLRLCWKLSFILPHEDELQEIDDGRDPEDIEDTRVICVVHLSRVRPDGTEAVELDLTYFPDLQVWHIEHLDPQQAKMSLPESILYEVLEKDLDDVGAYDLVSVMGRVFVSASDPSKDAPS